MNVSHNENSCSSLILSTQSIKLFNADPADDCSVNHHTIYAIHTQT